MRQSNREFLQLLSAGYAELWFEAQQLQREFEHVDNESLWYIDL